jgi:hypothetical protein
VRNNVQAAYESESQGRLLRTLAEELKLPLMQIARAAELARLSGDVNEIAQAEVLADTALRLVDSYVLSTQTMLGQQSLHLEPISLNAVMYDTAQYLHKLAKLYDCKIDLMVSGKHGLVMAHPQALQSALTSLGYSFINAMNDQGQGEKAQIILTASKNKHGIAAGIQTNNQEVGSKLLQQAKSLYGIARQPMAELTHSSGAGIMVANSLFDAMATQLKVIRHHSNSGLAATLLPSQQLALL